MTYPPWHSYLSPIRSNKERQVSSGRKDPIRTVQERKTLGIGKVITFHMHLRVNLSTMDTTLSTRLAFLLAFPSDLYRRGLLSYLLMGPLLCKNRRALILGWASYLYAFSSYPLCTWLPSVYRGHDNWYTRGASFPVLSY